MGEKLPCTLTSLHDLKIDDESRLCSSDLSHHQSRLKLERKNQKNELNRKLHAKKVTGERRTIPHLSGEM